MPLESRALAQLEQTLRLSDPIYYRGGTVAGGGLPLVFTIEDGPTFFGINFDEFFDPVTGLIRASALPPTPPSLAAAPFITLGRDDDLTNEVSILEDDEHELPDDDIHWKWDSASDRTMLIENIGAGAASLTIDGGATDEVFIAKVTGHTNPDVLIRPDGIFFSPSGADAAPTIGLRWSTGDVLIVSDLTGGVPKNLYCDILIASTISSAGGSITIFPAVVFQGRASAPGPNTAGWWWYQTDGVESFRFNEGGTVYGIALRDATTDGLVPINASGLAFDFQNTTDAASNQVGILRSGNRDGGGAQDDDEGYLSFYNDDDNEAQQEFSRLSWEATDVANASKDARISLDTMIANSLTEVFSIGSGTMRLIDNEIQDSGGTAQITIATSGNEVTVENDLRVDGQLGVNATPASNTRLQVTGFPSGAGGALVSFDISVAETGGGTFTGLNMGGINVLGDFDTTAIRGFNFAPTIDLDSTFIFVGRALTNWEGVTLALGAVSTFNFAARTITDSAVLRINAPSGWNALYMTVSDHRGIRIENQGNAAATLSHALDIEAQSGSPTTRSIRVLGSAVSIHQPDMTIGGTAAPTSTVDVNGSFAAATVAKTGAYTAAVGDHVITCDASGGAFTVTLPAASGVAGRIYHIKKTDSSGNAVTVDANGSETIDDALTQVINVQYDSMMIICTGSEWFII